MKRDACTMHARKIKYLNPFLFIVLKQTIK